MAVAPALYKVASRHSTRYNYRNRTPTQERSVDAPMPGDPWLVLLGFGVGTLGTLIGAGGGFILVPALILLYPAEKPEILTALSLSVVFFNALSGTIAYARMKRIDYKSGILFTIAGIPGALLGAHTVAYLPRRAFEVLFSVLMMGVAGYLMWRPGRDEAHDAPPAPDPEARTRFLTKRLKVGMVLSLFVGYIANLLGIGGGIIHVPAMIHLLKFPVHVATATSHFILTFLALAGTAEHAAQGAYASTARHAAFLALGAVMGAQVGARLSTRIRGPWIVRGLAAGLALAGIRILAMAAGRHP